MKRKNMDLYYILSNTQATNVGFFFMRHVAYAGELHDILNNPDYAQSVGVDDNEIANINTYIDKIMLLD